MHGYQPHMTVEQAQEKTREPIIVGATYTFYSDCVECKTDSENLIRSYSGQDVTVVRQTNDGSDGGERLYHVAAANGDTFDANEDELNDWIFDTGQWVGPRIY